MNELFMLHFKKQIKYAKIMSGSTQNLEGKRQNENEVKVTEF